MLRAGGWPLGDLKKAYAGEVQQRGQVVMKLVDDGMQRLRHTVMDHPRGGRLGDT
jgi:hypothetical protein